MLDVTGFYVVPGLVDLHAHVFGYEGSLVPDETALRAGTTTIVDAGGSGWRTFDEFRRTVIARRRRGYSRCINIVGKGMIGEPYESDVARYGPGEDGGGDPANKDVIVGIKTAHFAKPGWTAIDRAVEAGRRASVPVMVDDKIFTNSGRTTREELLDHLRPGDMHTHMYNDRQFELVDRFTGKVAAMDGRGAAARRACLTSGMAAAVSYGRLRRAPWRRALCRIRISTDLHSASVGIQQSDMPNVMSKMMLLGMSFADVLVRSTVNPAKADRTVSGAGNAWQSDESRISRCWRSRPECLRSRIHGRPSGWGRSGWNCVLTIRDGKLVYERGPVAAGEASAVIYDLLLKRVRIGDGKEALDIGIIGNRIAQIRPGLKAAQSRMVAEAEGYEVRRQTSRKAWPRILPYSKPAGLS